VNSINLKWNSWVNDYSKTFVLGTDAFNFVVGVVFSQLGEDNLLNHVGLCSHKFSHVKINHEIQDKKTFSHRACF
jgi:hypothetical protein